MMGRGFSRDHFHAGYFKHARFDHRLHHRRFFRDFDDGDVFISVGVPFYGLNNNYCFYDYYGRYVCPYYPY
jgi:hypothetical protein